VAKIAVIGGGIAGASLAFWRARRGDEVTLFEAARGLGGQLCTVREAGYIVEQGAEGFVAGSEVVAALARELGIAASLTGQLTSRSYVFDGDALHELARGEAAQVLGFQVPQRELGQGIRAFKNGMAELVEGLARELETIADLRVGSRVKRLTPRGGKLAVEANEATALVDRVFVATDARSAAALLAPSFGAPATELARAKTLSSVTVSLAYRRSAIAHELGGTGFVVAEEAQREGFRACTFTSSKLAPRAPEGHALLRAFFRPSADDIALLDDAAWVKRAERRLADVLAPNEPPQHSWVMRWPDALPVFDAEQRARVTELEGALAGSGVSLAGSAFHGSGIDAALRSARVLVEHSV
jgi:protoporphyrinogen/coproporphyrinogen III oxidase